MDPARGSDRARAAPGTRAGQGRRLGGGALARGGRRAGAGARCLARGRVRARCVRSPRRCSTRSPALPRPARRRRAGGLRGDRGRAARAGGAIRRPRRGCAAPGSVARSAACSASRSRASRATGSARSPRARATGRCAATSRRRASTRRVAERWPWNRASRPTSLRREHRRHAGGRRPQLHDARARSCSSSTARRSRASTSRRRGSTTCPPGRIFTAERVACRNLLLGLLPPETATYQNPFREWIGARLRVDAYGWAAPGDPARAARMAWEDARISHTANGVYAAMFMAAAHAATLADVDRGRGSRHRPRRSCRAQSRLAEAIRACARRERRLGVDRRCALRTLRLAALGARDQQHRARRRRDVPLHVDFDEAIGAVVAGGWDTDTNGAAIGSIFGALAGAGGIDAALERAAARHGRELAAGLRRELDRRASPRRTLARSRDRSPRSIPGRRARSTVRRRSTASSTRRRSSPRPTIRPSGRRGASALARWRARRAARLGYTARSTTGPSSPGRSGASRSRSSGCGTSCSTTSTGERFTPERLLDGGRARVRRVRRRRALARLSGDRHRRPQPVRLVPRRRRGCRELVARLHARGVRVFVDYNPWDVGTRREAVDDAARGRGDRAPARRRRRLPRHDEGGARALRARARRRRAPGRRVRGRVDAAARADRATTSCRGRSGSPTAPCPV